MHRLILTASTSWRSNCFRAPLEYSEGGLPSSARQRGCCCCCSPSTSWARTSAQTCSSSDLSPPRHTSTAACHRLPAQMMALLPRISAVVPVRTSAWNGELDWEGGSGGRCSCRTRRTCSALEVSAERPRDWMGSLRRSSAPRSEAG